MEQNQPLKTQAIFWVEAEKITPNSFQPRKTFDEAKLRELAESIRQYGILQPLVVIRREKETETGSIVEYELIAGERRWRAAKLVGLPQVPVIIREEQAGRVRLELALIENIQREDLNALERAKAFKALKNDFNLPIREIALKVGKSREFVSNSLRLLSLPEIIQQAIAEGRISEGHCRPLLMLAGTPEEQMKLFINICANPITVRQAEEMAKQFKTAQKEKSESPVFDPEIKNIQEKLNQLLGARITIEKKEEGGKISLEFFSEQEMKKFLEKIASQNPPAPEVLIEQNRPNEEELQNFTV